MKNRTNLLLVALLVIVATLVAMPQGWKQKIPDLPWIAFAEDSFMPKIEQSSGFRDYLLSKKINYGLDLAGGSQLDFRIDMSRVREKIAAGEDLKEQDILNGVKATLERRIDPDGTRELNIYTAEYDGEPHVYVELTADLDTPETRAKLQNHIDLQFKEPKAEADQTEKEATQSAGNKALEAIKGGEDFAAAGNRLKDDPENPPTDQTFRTVFEEDKKAYKDELPDAVAAKLWDAEPGKAVLELIENEGGFSYDMATGQLRPSQRFSLFRSDGKAKATRSKTAPGEDFTKVADEASKSEVREVTPEELPEDIRQKLLETVAPNQVSEVIELSGTFVVFKPLPALEETASIRYAQIVSDTREAADAVLNRVKDKTTESEEEQLTYDEIGFEVVPDPWKATNLDGQNFKIAKVAQDPNSGMSVVTIDFDTEGAKKFEELTARLVGKPMAIFVGGDFISAPVIQEKISGGSAQITLGAQNYFEAQKAAISLARDLNAGAIPAPITLDGELKIAPSLGQKALERSLTAGAIGFFLISLWLIFSYRLLGLYASFALAIYVLLFIFIIKSSSIFVLSLAGIAGIILSMGMAVDANVLIFERMREELKAKRNFSTALAIGFERAWTSIRDSNFTSLLVCLILYIFGTSIVKGFAMTLAIGILLSMFTAIIITRTFLRSLIGTKASRNPALLTKE